jgi:hypothetical protein
VPPENGAIEDAVIAAVRHLVLKPDAKLVLSLEPKDAKLVLYGEPLAGPPYPPEIPFWSGVYRGQMVREGYEPKTIRLDVTKGANNVTLALEEDPLFVGKPGDRAKAAIHDRRDLPPPPPPLLVETPPSAPSAWANPIAWAVVGAGGAVVVVGTLLMRSAQGQYNDLSGEVRYTMDRTRPASEAIGGRAQARSDFGTGATVATIGAVVAAGGMVWMIVDAIIRGPAPRTADVPSSEGGTAWAAF